MRPRRALVTMEFLPKLGGIERVLHERARGFRPEAVTVFAPRTDGAEEFDRLQPFTVRRCRSRLFAVPFLGTALQTLLPWLAFLREHRRRPFDELECGQAFPYPLLALACRRTRRLPRLAWVHGNDVLAIVRLPGLGRLLRRSLRATDRVVVLSSHVRELVRAAGVPEERIRVLRPSIDAPRFGRTAPDPELVRRHGLAGKAVLLTVGRLVERKGADRVLEALSLLVGAHPELVYLVAGSGPYEETLRGMTRRLGLERHVVFHGAAADAELPRLYSVASVFVMVSRSIPHKATVEGFGLVYLEAGASALPVVAGKSGGVADVVRDGENGLLVDPESPAEIAAAIRRLIEHPDEARRMGACGRALALRPANWEIFDLER